VDAAYEKLLKADPTVKDIPIGTAKHELLRQIELEKRAVAPAGQLVWKFENVKPAGPDEVVFVRFKYEVSTEGGDNTMLGRWLVGHQITDAQGGLAFQPLYVLERKDVARGVHEIALPADVVGPDGSVMVMYLSAPTNSTTLIFPLDDGIQMLYRSGTFAGNYLRGPLSFLRGWLSCRFWVYRWRRGSASRSRCSAVLS